MEGLSILGFGVLAAGALLVASFLTAPPESPGLLRFQALEVIAAFFALGATAGKGLHIVASWLRRPSRWFNRAA
jgi:hypothetical protein